jgi:formyl-CoA transferase
MDVTFECAGAVETFKQAQNITRRGGSVIVLGLTASDATLEVNPFNIVVNEQKHWRSLCDVVGRPEFKTDPRLAEANTRMGNRHLVRELLEEALLAKSAAEWESLFSEAGVPAGLILNLPDAIRHPQVESRQLLQRFEGVPGVGRDVEVARVGFRLGKEQPQVSTPPPQLGQDTERLLGEAGYSADQISEFRADGVI